MANKKSRSVSKHKPQYPARMPQALVKAVSLAQSPAASHLPGYGRLKLKEKGDAVKTIKKKGSQLRKLAHL